MWKLNLQKKGLYAITSFQQFIMLLITQKGLHQHSSSHCFYKIILTLFSMNKYVSLIYDSMSLAKYHKQLNLFLGNLEKCVRKD